MNKLIKSLLLILCAFFITACAGDGQTLPEEQNTEPEAVDLYGYVFNFELYKLYLPNFVVNNGETVIGDARLEQINQTQKDLNCVITFVKAESDASIFTDFLGGKQISAVYSSLDVVYNWAKSGMLIPLNELEAIDLQAEKWGGEKYQEAMSYKGNVYGVPVAGSFEWNPYPHYFGALLYNSILIDSLGGTDPHEEHEKKNWTYDTFLSLLELYYNGDPENTYYTATYSSADTVAKSAVFANGGAIINNTDGTYSFGLTDKKALTALEWTKTVLTSSAVKADKDFSSEFTSGHSAFWFAINSLRGTNNNNAQDAMNIMENFEFAPMPYGPDVAYGSVSSGFFTFNSGATGIVNGDEPDTSAIIYDRLFSDPYDGTYKEYFSVNSFFSSESFEIFEFNDKNANYDYSGILGTDITEKINTALMSAVTDKNSVAEAMSAISTAVNETLSSAQ